MKIEDWTSREIRLLWCGLSVVAYLITWAWGYWYVSKGDAGFIPNSYLFSMVSIIGATDFLIAWLTIFALLSPIGILVYMMANRSGREGTNGKGESPGSPPT